jgi:hypothetical protein
MLDVTSKITEAIKSQNSNLNNLNTTNNIQSFIPYEKLPGDKNIQKLYSEYLRQNFPINYFETPDKSRDPLTISLLINLDSLLEFINENKETDIINLYSDFSNSKVKLQTADQSYIDNCAKLAQYKTKFNLEITSIQQILKNNSNSNSNISINPLRDVQQIVQLKIDYMKHIFRIADDIMNIYNSQQIYFVTTKALLESLKKNYKNIINYYETPELALMCIDNDIKTLNLLINNQNNTKTSYYRNYILFKNFYENQLNKNKKELLEPNINYNEVATSYIDEPNLLIVEKNLYELYNFYIFLLYSKNQLDIWHIIFESINELIIEIGTKANSIITDILCANGTCPIF